MQEQEILDLEQQLSRALVSRDTRALEQLWAPSFCYTGAHGEQAVRAEMIAAIGAGMLRFEAMDFDDIRLRFYGDTAVVTGRATARGRSPMGDLSGQFRYTRVYVREDGHWRVVAFQGTAMAQTAPDAAGDTEQATRMNNTSGTQRIFQPAGNAIFRRGFLPQPNRAALALL
ncbi:MAG: nuclear transport factor 2 family protein [Blastocatellia bacterium]